MNFKGKGKSMDCFVSFSPDRNEFVAVQEGRYTLGKNKTVDELVFNRQKGAKLCIQASNFEHNRKSPCPKRIERRDPNPYLRNNEVRCLNGEHHVVHYPDKPDAPEYVREIFKNAGECYVKKTKHGGVQVFCVISGDIKKYSSTGYSLDAKTVKPVPWSITPYVFTDQLKITKEAKTYQRRI